MISSNSNFILDHGSQTLIPLAGLAVILVLYLIFDGVRTWLKKRHITRLQELSRQSRSVTEPLPEAAATVSILPTLKYFELNCHHCGGIVIVPEALRFMDINCPRCNELIYARAARPVSVIPAVREPILAIRR